MEVLADKGVPIIEWPSTSAKRMVQACAKFYDAVTGGNAGARWKPGPDATPR
jgi:hypothetical protein